MKVMQIRYDGFIVKVFDDITQASIASNISVELLTALISSGTSIVAGSYTWKYLKE